MTTLIVDCKLDFIQGGLASIPTPKPCLTIIPPHRGIKPVMVTELRTVRMPHLSGG
jgi:hypothetical protein